MSQPDLDPTLQELVDCMVNECAARHPWVIAVGRGPGCSVWLMGRHGDRHGVNLSNRQGVRFRGIAEAREFAKDFARRTGITQIWDVDLAMYEGVSLR